MAEKVKTKVEKTNTYESFEALYFTGKVKPALNKILAELKNQPSNLNLTLLACKCLVRTKDFDKLTLYADAAIDLDDKNAGGYYFKGLGLQHIKGKEQKALSNFDTALTLDPDNVVYLKGKAATHLLLFTDYHLHLGLAEKHRVKGEECLLKIVVSTFIKPQLYALRLFSIIVNCFLYCVTFSTLTCFTQTRFKLF